MKKPGKLAVTVLSAISCIVCVLSCKENRSSQGAGRPEGLVVYIGTYGENLYRYIFDPSDRSFTPLGQAALKNPSYLALGEENSKDGIYDLYAVSENGASSSVASFADDIKLSSTGECRNVGADPCFILFDNSLSILLTADYSGGSLSVFRVNADGSVGGRIQCLDFSGSGPVRGRQESSHIHQLKFLPVPSSSGEGDGTELSRWLLASDLGADRIRVMSLSGDTLVCHPELDILCGEGSGPRHMEIDTLRKRIYCLTELSGELLVFGYRAGEDGTPDIYREARMVADEAGGAASADIHLHPSGRFIYTSHRDRNDGISVFSVSDDGKVTRSGYCRTGKHPRNFAVTPDGAYMLVACRNDRSVEVYSIDAATGKLSFSGDRLRFKEDMPSCVVIAQ